MQLDDLFRQHFGGRPQFIAQAPGRVNLLGEHVDYNDGPVLPAAIDRSVRLAATPQEAEIVSLVAIDLEQTCSFRLQELDSKQDAQGAPLPDWARYPAGVAWALQQAGLQVHGMQVVFTSSVPIGAGLSSSAALEVGFAVLWQALGGWECERMSLALLCQKAENQYVGVACGIMDQFASAHGVEGHALYLDTRSLEWKPAPLPAGTALVIADSGIRRSLTTSAYNERRAACQQAVEILRAYLPHIRSLRDISSVEFAALSPHLPPLVRMRAEHVVKEISRVESALSALQREDVQAFGALMFAGHASLRDLYQVSLPELDTLVNLARNLPGCYGARLTGAGFGGCTVNLVEKDSAAQFIQALQEGYQRQTNRQAQVYLCQASQGAWAKTSA